MNLLVNHSMLDGNIRLLKCLSQIEGHLVILRCFFSLQNESLLILSVPLPSNSKQFTPVRINFCTIKKK